MYYERHERIAGESHYPLKKMLALAFDGITSLSVRPIRMVTGMGVIVSILGFIGIIWAVVVALMGKSIAGWASIVCIVCFLGGIQLLSLGITENTSARPIWRRSAVRDILSVNVRRNLSVIKKRKADPWLICCVFCSLIAAGMTFWLFYNTGEGLFYGCCRF